MESDLPNRMDVVPFHTKSSFVVYLGSEGTYLGYLVEKDMARGVKLLDESTALKLDTASTLGILNRK